MKKVFFAFLILVLGILSCRTFEPMTIYIDGYEPNPSCVRTDGYYLDSIRDESNELMYQVLWFYEDGTCH